MGKYKVVFSKDFTNMLHNTLEYYSMYSTNYVEMILKDIKTIADIISKFPHIGLKCDTNENVRKIIIRNKFVLIYKISQERIHVLYFIDGRMQNNNLELNETVELIYQI